MNLHHSNCPAVPFSVADSNGLCWIYNLCSNGGVSVDLHSMREVSLFELVPAKAIYYGFGTGLHQIYFLNAFVIHTWTPFLTTWKPRVRRVQPATFRNSHFAAFPNNQNHEPQNPKPQTQTPQDPLPKTQNTNPQTPILGNRGVLAKCRWQNVCMPEELVQVKERPVRSLGTISRWDDYVISPHRAI